MKYYLIAGEASGDLHAANLMKALMKQDAQAEFRFWGGDKMQTVGGEMVNHYREMNYMGFWEVATHLRTILRYMKQCKKDIVRWNPDVVILVDYPGFNMRIAGFAKKQGLPVFYYISPQVWAWRPRRVKKIKKSVDHMFVILPFEEEFYGQWDYKVDFVGHPLLDAIENLPPAPEFRQKHHLDEKPVIAILPGSRQQEIQQKLPVMAKMPKHFPDYNFVIAGLTEVDSALYNQYLVSENITVCYDSTYGLLQNAYAAIVTSGTATLEAALFEVPEVVCYKGGRLSYSIGRRLVNVEYISLVNLIMGKEVVEELIQDNFTEKTLKTELHRLLDEPFRQRMTGHFKLLKEKLGGSGASERTAALLMGYLKKG